MKGKDIEVGVDYAISDTRDERPWCTRKRCVGKGLSFPSRYYKDMVRESSGESLFVRVDNDGSNFPTEAPTEVHLGHQDDPGALRKVESHTHAQVYATWEEYEQKRVEWDAQREQERLRSEARKDAQRKRVEAEVIRLQGEGEMLGRLRELGLQITMPSCSHYVYEGKVEGTIESLIALIDYIKTLEDGAQR